MKLTHILFYYLNNFLKYSFILIFTCFGQPHLKVATCFQSTPSSHSVYSSTCLFLFFVGNTIFSSVFLFFYFIFENYFLLLPCPFPPFMGRFHFASSETAQQKLMVERVYHDSCTCMHDDDHHERRVCLHVRTKHSRRLIHAFLYLSINKCNSEF